MALCTEDFLEKEKSTHLSRSNNINLFSVRTSNFWAEAECS